MSAYAQLIEIALGATMTTQMIIVQIKKGNIKKLIDDHKEQFEVLSGIDLIINKLFSNQILNSQLKQLNNTNALIFDQLGQNLLQLQKLGNQIFKSIPSYKVTEYQPKATEIGMISLFGVSNIASSVIFFKKTLDTKFKQFKEPINSFGQGIRKALLRQRLSQLEITQKEKKILLAQYEEQIQLSERRFGIRDVIAEGWQYFKQNPFTTIGHTILGALKLAMFVASVYMIYLGVGTINDLDEKYQTMKDQLGQPLLDKQMTIMMVLGLMPIQLSNLLQQSYNLIYDIQNYYRLLILYNPNLSQSLNKSIQTLDPQNYLKKNTFNSQVITRIQNKALVIYNLYNQTKINVQKDPTNKQKIIVQALKTIKEKTNELLNSQKITQITDEIGLNFQRDVTDLSMVLNDKTKLMKNYKDFIVKVINIFSKRKNNLDQQHDSQRLELIIFRYTQVYVNPNIPIDAQLPTSQIEMDLDDQQQKINKKDLNQVLLNNIEKYDKQVRWIIFNYIASLTDKFYADDISGQTLFGFSFSEVRNKPNKSYIALTQLDNIDNVIFLPDQLPDEKENNQNQENGGLMTLQQLEKRLKTNFNQFDQNSQNKDKEAIVEVHRGKKIEMVAQKYYKKVLDEQQKLTNQQFQTHIMKFYRFLYVKSSITIEGKAVYKKYFMIDQNNSTKGNRKWVLEQIK